MTKMEDIIRMVRNKGNKKIDDASAAFSMKLLPVVKLTANPCSKQIRHTFPSKNKAINYLAYTDRIKRTIITLNIGSRRKIHSHSINLAQPGSVLSFTANYLIVTGAEACLYNSISMRTTLPGINYASSPHPSAPHDPFNGNDSQ